MKLQGHMIIGEKAVFIEDGHQYLNIEIASELAVSDAMDGIIPPRDVELERFVFVQQTKHQGIALGFWTREKNYHSHPFEKSKINDDFTTHYKALCKEFVDISETVNSLKEQLREAERRADGWTRIRAGRAPAWTKVDEAGLFHCETGPAIEWHDGGKDYFWHGVDVPKMWIENRSAVTASMVIRQENTERRAAGCQIIGWAKMLEVLEVKIINDSGNDDIGQLIEIEFPGENVKGLFLKAKCPRNGIIVEGVPRVSDIDKKPIKTALAAQAWRIGDPQSEYEHPPVRT